MASRIKTILAFLADHKTIYSIAKETGIDRMTVIGQIVTLWNLIFDDQSRVFSFSELSIILACKEDLVKAFCSSLASQEFGRLIDSGFCLFKPSVRHGKLSFSLEGKGGVSLKSHFFKSNTGNLNTKTSDYLNTPNPKMKKIEKTQIERCKEIWHSTLKHFGIHRSDYPREELEIARALMHSGFEITSLALNGAKFEAPTQTFDPAKHVSINRVLSRDKIEKFANLGAQALARDKKIADTHRPSIAARIIDEALK